MQCDNFSNWTRGSGSGGWETLAKKWNKVGLLSDGVPGTVFRAVHAWRDKVAREEDESTRCVSCAKLDSENLTK